MKLDRNQIVDTALAVLEETGIDGLTTRLIAQRLGVQQPALYWHFKSKRALLDAMNDAILERGHTRRIPFPDEAWRDFVRANALSFRAALLGHRDGARVHAGTEANPGDLDQLEQQGQILVDAGMSPGDAMELLTAIGRYTVGCVLEEQADREGTTDPTDLDRAAEKYPVLSAALVRYRSGGHEGLFRAGLELLIAGAQNRLNETSR
ncbi:MAG TPA: TetR/AcrR family transcriptional regulator C-terminal domain-containing protein [Gemmatimonadaceae bacterium]|jgi:TetR/AcrR family tetracycline transcriptional repressor